MSNVTNNKFNEIDLNISKSEYWDLVISSESDPKIIFDGSKLYDDTLISVIDINDDGCVSGDTLYGLENYKWDLSINRGLELSNVGFNLIDNGLIKFDKDSISESEFMSIVTGTTLTVNMNDMRLSLSPVSGNTGDYIYPYLFDTNHIGRHLKLLGGFYQGFFKFGEDYSILPDTFQDEISFEFVISPDLNAQPEPGTLNYKHKNNKGIFFYLGVRSENKFWYEYFKTDVDKYDVSKTEESTPLSISGDLIKTIDGFDINDQNIYDIETDNKYLLFNRTLSGLKASSFNNNVEYHITGVTKENINYYEYFNRTRTGHTASRIDSLTGLTKPYFVADDLHRNAIAFRIKDDGSIGYRMLNIECDGDVDELSLVEEYSNSGLVKNNELNFITVRVIMDRYSECGNSNRLFKLLFYINGKLVFISKSLPEIIFRNLNDTIEKQETIPYNISIGGGSQGLCDMIGFTDNSKTQYLLPIERYFAGSIIGDLYSFKIYYGKTDYSKILNNFNYQFGLVYNQSYITPTIVFEIIGVNIEFPETNYRREYGNNVSMLTGNVELNSISYPITGYKLYYTLDNDKTQINGVFPMSSHGGYLPNYVHNQITNSVSEVTYTIEILDTYSVNWFNKPTQNKTIIFDNMIFYGTLHSEPTESDDIRNLQGKAFSSDTDSFILDTGTVNNIFVIALPQNRAISSVYDENAFMLDITHLFSKVSFNVSDAGGYLKAYDIYTMKNAIPYTRNHKFKVTLE